MARTYTWDNTKPVGTEQPSRIDNWIRQTKLELQEMINQMIGVAEATALADPIIASDRTFNTLYTTASNAGGQNLVAYFPWYGTRIGEAGTIAPTQQSYLISGASATGGLLIPIVLPVGITVTQVGIRWFYNSTNHLATGTFRIATGSSVISSTTASPVAASASAQWIDSATVAFTTAADQFLSVEISLNNNNLDTATTLGLYGLRIEYTSPNVSKRL